MKKKDLNVQGTPPNVQDEAATLQTASGNVQDESLNLQSESVSVQTETPGVQVEDLTLQDESVNVQVAAATVQVVKPKKAEKKVKAPIKKEPTPPPPKKESTRKGITVMFSTGENSEYEHLSLIIKNRIEDGLSQNESHFVRQCIDYAINAQFFFEREIIPSFATHEEKMPWEYKLLKDALFAKNKKIDLRVCK